MVDETRYIEVIICTINALQKNGYLPNVKNIQILLKAMAVRQGKYFRYLNEDEHIQLLTMLHKWKAKKIRLVVDNTKSNVLYLRDMDA